MSFRTCSVQQSIRLASAGLVAAALIAGCSTGTAESDNEYDAAKPGAHGWSYEGVSGPEKWGDIDPEFATCKTGRAQSPINLGVDDRTTEAAKISIDYKVVSLKLENNGHTVQATVPPGNTIAVDGTSYELQQFHFHLPSEHTVRGEGAAMEVHFVHKDAAGKIAVLGVLMDETPGLSPFASIWKTLPAQKGETRNIDQPDDLNSLLPQEHGSFQYEGSLTTPPCSEGVRWVVLRQVVGISPEEVNQYRKIFPRTNRPVQPRNDRDLVTTAN
ncbi:carbonic anhydrase family protein [Streptomyces sp. TRM66268-LWL]|uniref:carbonic anhydrase n=1 Tax=Streptomyces polyasparticus TaxID=2767826 RepID=A0ABR7SY43_9ACTN|nr:carbonic anhydrase family protein [Streptomyces polyasparticus]MBC9719562.1 carbonic anhydrase family protein [Streptomyces polyasparticus]